MKTIPTIKKSLVALLAVALIAPAFTGCKKGAEDPMVSLKSRDSRITGTWELMSGESTTVVTTITSLKNDVNGDKNDETQTSTTTWSYSSGVDTKVTTTNTDETDVYVNWDDNDTPFVTTDDVALTTTDKIKTDVSSTTVKNYTVSVSIFKDNTYTATYTETAVSDKYNQTVTFNGNGSITSSDTVYSPASTSTWTEEGTWYWLDSRKNKVMIGAGPLAGNLLQLKSKELILSDATNETDVDTDYFNTYLESFANNQNQNDFDTGILTETSNTTTTWTYSQTWEKTDKASKRD